MRNKENCDEENCCRNCRFFHRHEYETLDVIANYGSCVRYPPRAISEDKSLFPLVTDDCFCGEWKSKM